MKKLYPAVFFNKIIRTQVMCFVVFFNLYGCLDEESGSKLKIASTKIEGMLVESVIELKGKKIGYCTPSLNAPYYQALLQSVKATTEENGMIFFSSDGQNDLVKQIAAVEDLIAKDVDALLLNPIDPNALIGVTKLAKKAGIPVFIVDGSISAKANFITIIQSDNYLNAILASEWLFDNFKKETMEIALLRGSVGNPVGQKRSSGLLSGLARQQLIKNGFIDLNVKTQMYTDWTYAGGLKAMEDILVAHPDVNVIMAEADVCVLGAIEAIKRAGKINDIVIVAAADGQKEAIKYIMETDFYGCTGMNSPIQVGYDAVKCAVQYMNGKRDFFKESYTKPLLITKKNAKEYYNPNALF